MNLLRFFQRRSPAPATESNSPEPIGSAAAARDRLTVLLSHERAVIGQSKLVEALRDEILTVIAKHVEIALNGGANVYHRGGGSVYQGGGRERTAC